MMALGMILTQEHCIIFKRSLAQYGLLTVGGEVAIGLSIHSNLGEDYLAEARWWTPESGGYQVRVFKDSESMPCAMWYFLNIVPMFVDTTGLRNPFTCEGIAEAALAIAWLHERPWAMRTPLDGIPDFHIKIVEGIRLV